MLPKWIRVKSYQFNYDNVKPLLKLLFEIKAFEESRAFFFNKYSY